MTIFEGQEPSLGEGVFIAPGAVVSGEVKMGRDSSVFYYTVIRGDVNSITIGSETNIQEGKLSVNSPIGKGLLGKKAGDIAEINVPNGIMTLEVLEISRK